MAWNNNQRGGGGQQQSYPNSGALFSQQKKSQNAPDMNGNIVISEDVLDYVLKMAQQGEVKLEISGWRRQAQSGVNFLSLKVQTPYAERQQNFGDQQQNPQYRPQQGYQRRPAGDREERAQYGNLPQSSAQRQQNDYQQASGGRYPNQRQRPAPISDEEFKAGDRMPDFMRDDNDDPPPF
jgi:hypothetical protein